MRDQDYMKDALRLARSAAALDEVPVGAVIAANGMTIGLGSNMNISSCDPTAHAEIVALREACDYTSNYRLLGATVYVTLEPCVMCFAALIHARVKRLVFGAEDPKGGYRRFLDAREIDAMNHDIHVVSGVEAAAAATLLRDFFRAKRERGRRAQFKLGGHL